MIVSDTFWDWVKYETDAAAIADVCKVLAGVKDAEDLDGHARVMAMTFRDHTAATVSAIETKRANWKREKAKARELSNGQENCPTDKNDVRTIQSTNQSTNQPINITRR